MPLQRAGCDYGHTAKAEVRRPSAGAIDLQLTICYLLFYESRENEND